MSLVEYSVVGICVVRDARSMIHAVKLLMFLLKNSLKHYRKRSLVWFYERCYTREQIQQGFPIAAALQKNEASLILICSTTSKARRIEWLSINFKPYIRTRASYL